MHCLQATVSLSPAIPILYVCRNVILHKLLAHIHTHTLMLIMLHSRKTGLLVFGPHDGITFSKMIRCLEEFKIPHTKFSGSEVSVGMCRELVGVVTYRVRVGVVKCREWVGVVICRDWYVKIKN